MPELCSNNLRGKHILDYKRNIEHISSFFPRYRTIPEQPTINCKTTNSDFELFASNDLKRRLRKWKVNQQADNLKQTTTENQAFFSLAYCCTLAAETWPNGCATSWSVFSSQRQKRYQTYDISGTVAEP